MYALRQAFLALKSNWVATVATITTMTLSLTLLASFSLISVNLNLFLAELQNELEVTVFLDDGANHPQLLEVIRGWSEVDTRRVVFIGKDEALSGLVSELPALSQAAALVSNPLPNAIEVRLLDRSEHPAPFSDTRSHTLDNEIGGHHLRTTATKSGAVAVDGARAVDVVMDGAQDVEMFLAINDALRVVGSILIVIMLTAALFAITNSIRAAIVARRKEIEVMRLVGATQGFIRAPFLLEGLLLGFFSAVITSAIVIPSYLFIVDRLRDQLTFVRLVDDPTTLTQIPVLLLVLALLVGLVGSTVGVAQHLREEY